MVSFSLYPADPRPRRAAGALVKGGMSVDLICLGDGIAPQKEELNGISILRIPISHRRGGKLSYAFNYFAFIFISAAVLALRSLIRRYDLVYVNNMPDVLVASALVPKALGAKVLLDLHDPMPELMATIFGFKKSSWPVRAIQRLEKWSMARANCVLTVNNACRRIFASRSCPPDKINVVMNSPDEQIFPLRTPRSGASAVDSPGRPFVVMYHGTIVERNGLDLAVEAVAQVQRAGLAVELRIYGRETPFLDQVIRQACNKGIEDRVRYLGPRRLEDLAREIEDCDVGIIPNQRSAFADINTPTRIFEYLALGKPVIAPRTSGIQDYFDSQSLLFFESGNPNELTEQIEFAALNYREAMEIARRGQRIYLEHTWTEEREKLVDVICRLLGRET
jgi:glycosyltransferase involved in cell wall biosynthesis